MCEASEISACLCLKFFKVLDKATDSTSTERNVWSFDVCMMQYFCSHAVRIYSVMVVS